MSKKKTPAIDLIEVGVDSDPLPLKIEVPLDPPQRALQPVSLRQFLSLEFPKLHLAGAFPAMMATEKPRTIPEWRKLYQQFMSRPVRR
jgi:hypothetical protein